MTIMFPWILLTIEVSKMGGLMGNFFVLEMDATKVFVCLRNVILHMGISENERRRNKQI